jgi:hypothetical protein
MPTARKILEPIKLPGGLTVDAGGGLVDVTHKPYREPECRALVLAPTNARALAAALITAADAAEGKFPKAA